MTVCILLAIYHKRLMMIYMNEQLITYFSKIGKKGGQNSKRQLRSDTARNMVRVREARRAFKRFYANCFWSYKPNTVIQFKDVSWVAEQLMKHGNREAWKIGSKLCR